jgi:tRNA acetyltransferase TAN1
MTNQRQKLVLYTFFSNNFFGTELRYYLGTCLRVHFIYSVLLEIFLTIVKIQNQHKLTKLLYIVFILLWFVTLYVKLYDELLYYEQRLFASLESGCNGCIFIQMHKRAGDPGPVEIVQNMMSSAASTRKHMSRF